MTVMTLSVYGGDAELWTVRLYAGLVLDTMTLGYRSTKMVMMHSPITAEVAANAQPSRWAPTSAHAATTRMAIRSSTGLRNPPPPAVTCVQPTNASTTSPVTGAIRRASRPARYRTSPVVLSAMKMAP